MTVHYCIVTNESSTLKFMVKSNTHVRPSFPNFPHALSPKSPPDSPDSHNWLYIYAHMVTHINTQCTFNLSNHTHTRTHTHTHTHTHAHTHKL